MGFLRTGSCAAQTITPRGYKTISAEWVAVNPKVVDLQRPEPLLTESIQEVDLAEEDAMGGPISDSIYKEWSSSYEWPLYKQAIQSHHDLEEFQTREMNYIEGPANIHGYIDRVREMGKNLSIFQRFRNWLNSQVSWYGGLCSIFLTGLLFTILIYHIIQYSLSCYQGKNALSFRLFLELLCCPGAHIINASRKTCDIDEGNMIKEKEDKESKRSMPSMNTLLRREQIEQTTYSDPSGNCNLNPIE